MPTTPTSATFEFDLLGGRVKVAVHRLGPRRRGVSGVWSTPGGGVRVPFKGVLMTGVNVNMSKLLPEVPENVVAALTALLAPVLGKGE